MDNSLSYMPWKVSCALECSMSLFMTSDASRMDLSIIWMNKASNCSADSRIAPASLRCALPRSSPRAVKSLYDLAALLMWFPFLLNFCDCLIFPSVDLYRDYFNDSFKIKAKVFILPSESISGTENMYKRLMIHLLGHKFSENINGQLFNNIEKFLELL